MILTGKNLGARQQELNLKVKEAAERNSDFNGVKDAIERSDIDILFKIDLAIKFENVDYIIEKLKCGDRLHISRALKALWLYNDEHSHIINPQYLHDNIFPFMSFKMRNIFLGKISCNLRNENRGIEFYKYCIQQKLKDISFKFLLIAPQSFKLKYIEENGKELQYFVRDKEIYLRYFLENSFMLTNALFANTFKSEGNHVLYMIRHMYSVSDVQYLDLVEKYGTPLRGYQVDKKLGLRISKDIMQKYKERVLNKPLVYVTLLNANFLAKYSNIENAKFFLSALLPLRCTEFWDTHFCNEYKSIIDIIPLEERFQFVKTIFCSAYPGEEFETSTLFARNKYYELMPPAAREDWALAYIQHEETKGSQGYFQWYAFVNFRKAFVEIKKLIMVTTNREIRSDMVNVLIQSAKTQRDLEILFNYYYDRHVNEDSYKKKYFLNTVIEEHDVLEFDEKCWMVFRNILLSLDIYDDSILTDDDDYDMDEKRYIVIDIVYHIIHGMEIDQKHKLLLKQRQYSYNLKCKYNRKNMLNPEMQEVVCSYLVDYYINEIKQFDDQPYNDEIKENLRVTLSTVINILDDFNKRKDHCPEIVMKYVKLDRDYYKRDRLFREYPKVLTQDQILRDLKKDTALVVNGLPLVKESIKHVSYANTYYLNVLVRKLRIYFSNDIAKLYIQLFKDILADKITGYAGLGTNIAVYGIIQLADNTFKIDFMKQHAPTASKIDHKSLDRYLLRIQEGICRFACYARPPVPLDIAMMFIKGDYVHYSLPMFNMYMANLPMPLCMEFITRILDSPVSIRKHGLRLAFKCFTPDNVKKLTLDIWKKTKNVSLRMIIYKAVFDLFIKEENQTGRTELFEALEQFTRDLHENDDDEVFALLTSYSMPEEFVKEYIEAGWYAVSKLPSKANNFRRMSRLITYMAYKIELVRLTARPIVDTHIDTMLVQKDILTKCDLSELEELNGEKLRLTANYITHVSNSRDLEESLDLLRLILKNYFENWNNVDCVAFRKSYLMLTMHLRINSRIQDSTKTIFEILLKNVEEALPLQQRYLHEWELRLDIINIDILTKHLAKIGNRDYYAMAGLIKGSILNFTKEIGSLVKEYVDKGLYFRYFSKSIVKLIVDKLTGHYIRWPKSIVNMDDVFVIAALALANIEVSEICFIALQILPANYTRPSHQEDYKLAIEKIKALKDLEILCFFNEKFVYTGDVIV